MKNQPALPADIVENGITYSIHELCELTRLDETTILEFVSHEVIVADNENDLFSYQQYNLLLKGQRLKRDFELNTAGVALVLQLLDTIEDQEQELKLLRFQL